MRHSRGFVHVLPEHRKAVANGWVRCAYKEKVKGHALHAMRKTDELDSHHNAEVPRLRHNRQAVE